MSLTLVWSRPFSASTRVAAASSSVRVRSRRRAKRLSVVVAAVEVVLITELRFTYRVPGVLVKRESSRAWGRGPWWGRRLPAVREEAHGVRAPLQRPVRRQPTALMHGDVLADVREVRGGLPSIPDGLERDRSPRRRRGEARLGDRHRAGAVLERRRRRLGVEDQPDERAERLAHGRHRLTDRDGRALEAAHRVREAERVIAE